MSADTATAPQLRPLALGEILDVAIKLLRRNWRTLAILVLVVSVPVAIISLLITTSTTTYDAGLDTRSADDGAAYDAGVVVNGLLQLLLYLLATVACFLAIADAYLGRQPDWRSSLRFAARRSPAVFVMSVLIFLGLFVGVFFLVIGAIFLAVRWSVAMPALLLERRGPISALGRSWSLVKGFWWKCFGTLLVTYLLVTVLSFAIGAVLGGVLAVITNINSLLGLVLQEVVSVGVQMFTLPLFAAVTIVLYVDLRVRKEGFDLALMADHIAHPDQPASFAPALDAPSRPAPYGPPSEASPEPSRHPAFGE
jgi:hypothetical protein